MRDVIRLTINNWFDDRASRSAAALAYYAVFSLAPLLLISIGISGLILGHDQARAQIMDQATYLVGPSGASAIEALMGSRESAPRAGLISTIVGTVTLLIGAVGVLAQLKDALNTVWDVEGAGDSWGAFFRSYVMNMALVVAAGFLLLTSLIATAVVSAATSAARSWLPGPDVMWMALDAVIGLAMTTAVFALIFKVVPDAPVQWEDVRLGAFVTAILFTVGRLALGAYLGSGGSNSAYGAAGSVLALLAWIYYSSQLVLLGAEFTHAYAGNRRRPEPRS
ncbi:MAG: YihY/virulence factor BrkB family protein [Acidobacteria bacterium]|nr:YihY/virulence factor BrkB family protein [Acidobacteriota bacterium]